MKTLSSAFALFLLLVCLGCQNSSYKLETGRYAVIDKKEELPYVTFLQREGNEVTMLGIYIKGMDIGPDVLLLEGNTLRLKKDAEILELVADNKLVYGGGKKGEPAVIDKEHFDASFSALFKGMRSLDNLGLAKIKNKFLSAASIEEWKAANSDFETFLKEFVINNESFKAFFGQSFVTLNEECKSALELADDSQWRQKCPTPLANSFECGRAVMGINRPPSWRDKCGPEFLRVLDDKRRLAGLSRLE